MAKFIFSCLFIAICVISKSQKISYSEIEKEDSKNMNVKVIGKFADKLVVYKSSKAENYFSVYNNNMTIHEKIKLKSLPDKLINTDFVKHKNGFYMIYQYQKKSIIYCEAYKYNSAAKLVEESAQVLDTTSIPQYANDNKIYNIQVSDDKSKIAILKGYKKTDKVHIVGVVLYDNMLNKMYKKLHLINMDSRNNYLDEFVLDNDGDVFIAKCYSNSSYETISKFDLIKLPNNGDSVRYITMPNEEKFLDKVILKVDNANKKIIAQSFYTPKRKGSVEGIVINTFNKSLHQAAKPVFNKFSDSFRVEAKGLNNIKIAFNDFFIKDIFVKKDGGFITTSESNYTQSRGNNAIPWDRYDYYSSMPYINSYDYYNMGMRSWYWNGWDRQGNTDNYISENIAVMSFDKNGNLEWTNVVHKDQKEEGSDLFVSHNVILTGGVLHFLFNEKDRGDYLLFDNSITVKGAITRHPTLKNLNRNYQLLPRKGEQVTAREIVFPCVYKNYICLAKLEY
jgi:hypothetical protein